MAKGQAAKQEVMATILSTFSDSFMYNGNKEIRINTTENGEPVQIKVTLTAAKVAVSPEDENAVPGAAPAKTEAVKDTAPTKEESIVASDEEKEKISNLMAELGL